MSESEVREMIKCHRCGKMTWDLKLRMCVSCGAYALWHAGLARWCYYGPDPKDVPLPPRPGSDGLYLGGLRDQSP